MRGLVASLQFALVSAGQNFRRNLAVSLASVLTMGLILILVSITLIGTHQVNNVVDTAKTKASNLRIYLNDGVSFTSIEHYRVALLHDPRVIAVSVENKDQAKQEGQGQVAQLQNAINLLGGNNPLPASLNLSVRQLQDLSSLNDQAKLNPLVDHQNPTDYNPDLIPKLQKFDTIIKIIGISLTIILGFISLIIIMNTIRTAVFVRRAEIEIMKLVGATDWFVRWPFIIEGALGGFIAAVLASIVILPGYRVITSLFSSRLLSSDFSFDVGYLLFLMPIIFLIGVSLGSFGSYLGVRRFLTV